MADTLDASGRETVISEVFAETIALHEQMMRMDPAPVMAAADTILAAFTGGSKVLVFGNGGSAGDAQHLAAELVGRFHRERRALPVLAIAADPSVLTCIANDFSYEAVFARQIEALGRPGDVAVAITTSGRSPNVRAGLEAARARGLTTVALTGSDGGGAGAAADIHINVPARSAARVQEVHRTLIHALCELVERGLPEGTGTRP